MKQFFSAQSSEFVRQVGIKEGKKYRIIAREPGLGYVRGAWVFDLKVGLFGNTRVTLTQSEMNAYGIRVENKYNLLERVFLKP